ncbi:MAG: hypothetical protein U9Q33_08245 [Campylobacterota bacterium]|nr:hypothetical protein [Campylobacterota bacterium]
MVSKLKLLQGEFSETKERDHLGGTTHNLLLTNTSWKHKVEFEYGIRIMFDWYLNKV